MNLHFWDKRIAVFLSFVVMSCCVFANENLFSEARSLQRSGDYEGAIAAFKRYLLLPINEETFGQEQVEEYADALMQLMNTFQSKGEPEACISTLRELYDASPILQKLCLRDYYSVMGYALSRTEKMKEAEEVILKTFTIPLHMETPERFFRDYAYAAAVFYSNPDYQQEVIGWCQAALQQAQLCKNTSGKQWVAAMLGSIYKRNGRINEALMLFRQSKEEAQQRGDDLGVLNSLHALIDLFLYWDVPEYANLYASEAIQVERSMTTKNPMVSAQTYINKGRALQQLGQADSVAIYADIAKEFCQALPYNSGMVDVDLLHGIYLTEKDGDSLHLGIQELQQVARQGTAVNRAKAFHQLGLVYLKQKKWNLAEIMLDNMYELLSQSESPIYIHVEYKPILNYYLYTRNQRRVEQYTRMMLQEQQALKEKRLNFNLVETIAESQNAQQRQELKIMKLEQANQRIWGLVGAVVFVVVILIVIALLLHQKRLHKMQLQRADDKLAALAQQLHKTSAEKNKIVQEIDELMNDKDSRQELKSLTPAVLQKRGETKFRQRFELLYPLFLPTLRERVPSITRREELLSMLVVLKQDNRGIAELLSIAPRSVLMLRHRLRQKIGLAAGKSFESFIDEILNTDTLSETVSDFGEEIASE